MHPASAFHPRARAQDAPWPGYCCAATGGQAQGCARVSALQWICVRAGYTGPLARQRRLPSATALAAADADARRVMAAGAPAPAPALAPAAAQAAAAAPAPAAAGRAAPQPATLTVSAPARPLASPAARPSAWGAVVRAEPSQPVCNLTLADVTEGVVANLFDRPAPACRINVPPRAQCGGAGGTCAGAACVDAQWPDSCCQSPLTRCFRYSAKYWECRWGPYGAGNSTAA